MHVKFRSRQESDRGFIIREEKKQKIFYDSFASTMDLTGRSNCRRSSASYLASDKGQPKKPLESSGFA